MAGGAVSEPPLHVGSREDLVYLLGEACEIEHGLLCEYLYAQFSLKRGIDEGVTAEQLSRIRTWEQVLIDIAKQEMLHLALANNLLTAIGASPHLERPNFPILARWYPPDVQLALLPFGEDALRHFMYLERPEGMSLEDAHEFVPRATDGTDPEGAPLTAGAQEWHTVGHLYRGIEAGLRQLVDRHGERDVFIGPVRAQATTAIFEWPELTVVADLASASRAIEVIVEQGEGARGDWVRAHFGRFVGVLEDLLAVRAADPGFEPARPVLPVYVHDAADVESPALVEDPLTRRVADLFNAVYETVMQLQSRYFVHHGETAAELDTLARTVKHLMTRVMRPLGAVLTALPVGPRYPGLTAGPAFEIARPAFYVLPHRRAAWRVLAERLRLLADAARELGVHHTSLRAVGDMAGALQRFADDLDAHIEARADSD